MTAPTASRPPAGMPPHLWELAKRDVRGSVPDRIRNAADASATAPSSIRAIARRAATAGATLGAAAAAVAFGAGTATAESPVDLAGFDGAPPAGGATGVDGGHAGGPGGPGGGPGGGHGGGTSFGASGGTEGSMSDGPVSSGLGATFSVPEGAHGAETTLTVSILQDVNVVETADGMFQVDAYQYIVITDSDGHEYVFQDHYQVVVPDPPGQETDLLIHETGHVQIVENPDGSFTPVGVEHGIEVLVGSDGDGRDEIGITQDESAQVDEHGRHDPGDTTINLDEEATTDSEDVGDEAFTEIDQATGGGTGTTSGSGANQADDGHPWDQHPGFDELPGSTVPTSSTTTGTSTGSGTGSGGAGSATTGTPGTGTTGTAAGGAGSSTGAGLVSSAGTAAGAVAVTGPFESSLGATPVGGIAWSGPAETVAPVEPAHGDGPGAITGPDGAGGAWGPHEVFAGPGPVDGGPGAGPAGPGAAGADHPGTEPSGTAGADTGGHPDVQPIDHGDNAAGGSSEAFGGSGLDSGGHEDSGHEDAGHEDLGHGADGHDSGGAEGADPALAH